MGSVAPSTAGPTTPEAQLPDEGAARVIVAAVAEPTSYREREEGDGEPPLATRKESEEPEEAQRQRSASPLAHLRGISSPVSGSSRMPSVIPGPGGAPIVNHSDGPPVHLIRRGVSLGTAIQSPSSTTWSSDPTWRV